MPDRVEEYTSPEEDRIVLHYRGTGEVWVMRRVVGSEKTEALNVARASWRPLNSNGKANGRGPLSVVR